MTRPSLNRSFTIRHAVSLPLRRRTARSKKSPFRFLIVILILVLVLILILILILILQWTYRDSVLSSDVRLHVNPIHFLARRAVYQWLLGDSTQSKSKFHHQTYSKLTSTTPFSYAESAGNVSTSFGTSHVEVSGLSRAPSTHVRRS